MKKRKGSHWAGVEADFQTMGVKYKWGQSYEIFVLQMEVGQFYRIHSILS